MGVKELKGPGYAVLGNFDTDQLVEELTKISKQQLKTVKEFMRKTEKPIMGMDEQNWSRLKSVVFSKLKRNWKSVEVNLQH